MRKLLLMLLGLFCFVTQSLAQNRTISGRVTDETGKPMPNVSVQVKGLNIGTTTNEQGQYTLSVPANARTLTFTSIGAAPKEVNIGAGNTVNTSLASADQSMQEVVVVGYGSGRRAGTTVGSVATVNAEKIQDRPTANAFDALQGKVAGLQVFTSSGEPSAISSLRLHGVGSLSASSTPLYVMDGIPIDPGTVVSLNPNDFESVSILKDASATSIYGARAANGVVYITTKKGSPNRPASITLQTQYGISNLANTDYFENFMNTKELTDFWVETGYRTRPQIDALLTQYPSDTRWYKTYYEKNVPMYQADLSISGGAGKTSYYISGSYLDQEGLAYRSGFKRYTLRSNINTTVNDWFRLGLNLFGGYDTRQTNPYGSNSTNRGLALLAAPFYSPNDPKTGQMYYGLIPGWARYHPIYLADKIQGTGKNTQFNPTGYIQLSPIRNLVFKTQGGVEAYDYVESAVQLPSFIGSLNNGSASEGYTRGVTRTITNTLDYKFSVGQDNNFTALVGQEYIDGKTSAFSTSSTGQSDDRLILLSNGPNNRTSTSSISEYSYLSYFARLDYNWRNKYFVDGSFRQDQSSRFGVDQRTAHFWSAGAMWKAKQESFLSNVNWLTDLTVRASIGTTGNSSIGNYQSRPLVGTNVYDNGTGFGITTAGNPELSWESQTKTTIGINSNLFNRVRLNLEFYNRVTTDMLINVPFPYTSGFASVISNVGKLVNRGIDVTLDADVLKSRNAYITPYVNLNYNKNEITELFQGKEYWIIPNTGVSWAIGQPVSYFYPIWKGVNPANGNPEWYLPNADPTQIINTRKDPNAVTSSFATSLEQNTGIQRYPPFNGGFGFTSGYNGVFLNADFTFSQGKYLINNDRYFFENPSAFPGFNQSRDILNYWKRPGDATEFPRYGVQFTQFDSRLIEDASFIRLKAVTVGYDVPAKVLNRTKVFKGIRFYATGRNLLTFTKYSGPDPEVDSNLTLGANPNTKQVAFGLDFTF